MPKLSLVQKGNKSTLGAVDPLLTDEARELFQRLKAAQGNHIYFGQVRFYEGFYNASGVLMWRVDQPLVEEEIDSYQISGKYPAVCEFDPYRIIQFEPGVKGFVPIHYNNGGICSMSMHLHNFVTGGNTWDKTGDPVRNILPGGSHRAVYLQFLDLLANFFKTILDNQGKTIPCIFRPFHENDGGWFWWGKTTCTGAEFRALWQDMFDYLTKVKGVHSLIWCYSPDHGNGTDINFYERYPGDDYVDIIGIDRYSNEGTPALMTHYRRAANYAEHHGKLFAITEGVRDQDAAFDQHYWTDTFLGPILVDPQVSRAAYILVWHGKNAPRSDRGDKWSFLDMVNHPKVRMRGDS